MGKTFGLVYSLAILSLVVLLLMLQLFPGLGNIILILLFIDLSTILIMFTSYIIFFGKKAGKAKFVRNLTEEEKEKINNELVQYKKIPQRLISCGITFIIAVILFRSILTSGLSEILIDSLGWIFLLTIIFSVIVFVRSLSKLDRKTVLEKDLKKGIYSITGPARLTFQSKNRKFEKIINLRIGSYEMSVNSSLLTQELLQRIRDEKPVYIEFFFGSQNIISLKISTEGS